jgi:Tol biopolymer transport system component
MVFSQWSVYRQGLWRIRGPSYKGKDRSPAPVLPSTRQDRFPAYSPDGKRLAFSSTRSGFAEIWICNSDGTKPVQLTNLRKRSNIPRWFHNGRQILFGANGSYVIDADGGIPQRLDKERSDGWALSWSRDGQWTYFTSGVSGRSQVWKMPSEGRKAVQIARGGAENAMESFDGKMLYYV